MAECPDGIVQTHQSGVDLLELLRAHDHVPGLQGHFEAGHNLVQLLGAPSQCPERATVADQAGQAGHTL